MNLNLRIECLPEPSLVFGGNATGVEPRRMMTRWGAADKVCAPKQLRLGIVGPSADVQFARNWLPRLNSVAIARERSAKRYRDWPGAEQVLGVTFVVDDRFVRPVDDERLTIALQRTSPADRFEEILDLFDARIQGLFGDSRPDCIIVCLPEELAELRISNPRLSAKEREILERLQREEEQEQMSLFQPTPEELKAAEELRTTAEDLLFRTFYRAEGTDHDPSKSSARTSHPS